MRKKLTVQKKTKCKPVGNTANLLKNSDPMKVAWKNTQRKRKVKRREPETISFQIDLEPF